MREAKIILNKGEIFIDGIIRKNHNFPVGLMDVIAIPNGKKQFRTIFDQRGKLTLVPISSSDAEWKLRRIENKCMLPGKKIQLSFHDGFCLIVDKDEYHSGDVLVMDFKNKKVKDVYSKEKGTISLITGGTHIGELATIDDIEIIASSKPNLAVMKGEKSFTTLEKYVFPVGKTKPVISLPEVRIR
jgi:small subunit ribosomal protein S4e